jgi:PAS domain-containing protein
VIIIRERLFWIAMALIVIALISLGVYAWIVIPGAATADEAAAKFISERVLFFALVTAGILVAAGIGLFAAARAQSRAAENMMTSRRWMDDGGEQLEVLLGSLGRSFYRINRELIETNQRRGLKIQGMNALLAFVVKNFDGALMVVNAAGEIVYVSNDYLEKAGLTRSELIRKQLNAVLPDIYFSEVISEFGRNPVMLERQSDGRNYHLYDIMDKRGEIAYVVVTPGGRSFQSAASQEGDDNRVPVRRRRFSWLFGNKGPDRR